MWYNMRVSSELHHTPKGYETHCRRIVAECQQQRRDFLAKQILDDIPTFGKFDSCQPSEKSLACQTYSYSSIAKAEVALMTLGKTSFCDIAAHQKDDLFADAIGGAVPSEPTFRQRLAYLAFNVLRRIGQTALQVEAEGGTKRPERIRLRTVILTLMYAAAIDGSHGGRKYLRLGRNCHRAKTFQAVFRRLAA